MKLSLNWFIILKIFSTLFSIEISSEDNSNVNEIQKSLPLIVQGSNIKELNKWKTAMDSSIDRI